MYHLVGEYFPGPHSDHHVTQLVVLPGVRCQVVARWWAGVQGNLKCKMLFQMGAGKIRKEKI